MSTVKPKKTIRKGIIRHLREWHRKLGILAAFFLIFLSVTGIALNHTNLFSLAHSPIKNSLLLDHYGIKSPQDIRFFHQHNITVTEYFVWLQDQLLFESSEPIISVGKYQQFWLVLSKSQLSLYSNEGELVDRLSSITGLPGSALAMAVEGNHLIINTDKGYFQTDSELYDWQKISPFVEPTWFSAKKASEELINTAKINYRSQFLSWERIVVDAHSGRLFGNIGVIFMDVVAIMLILLSISGIYLWVRHARAKRSL